MTPGDVARAEQIRARLCGSRYEAITVLEDVPWLLDRLAAETARADRAETEVRALRSELAGLCHVWAGSFGSGSTGAAFHRAVRALADGVR